MESASLPYRPCAGGDTHQQFREHDVVQAAAGDPLLRHRPADVSDRKRDGIRREKIPSVQIRVSDLPHGSIQPVHFQPVRYLHRVFYGVGILALSQRETVENGADVRNRGHLQVPCGPVFSGAYPSEGEEDPQPDQIYGCDGAASSRGDRPESGVGGIPPERVRIRSAGICAEIFFRGLLQRHQSHGCGCGFRSGVGLPEKSGRSGRTGFLGGIFLRGGKFFHFRIFHMESPVDPSDGAFPGAEYPDKRQRKSPSDDHQYLHAGHVYFQQPEYGGRESAERRYPEIHPERPRVRRAYVGSLQIS